MTATPWTSEDAVAVNGVDLHYYRTGAGDRPPLVMVHGITDIAGVWGVTAAALAERYDVIAYDARGHGRSSKPASGYTPAQLADDLAAFVAALGLRRPALLGHSMGGATVALAAAADPALASCALLEDPAWPSTTSARSEEEGRQFADAWEADLVRLQGLTEEGRAAACRAANPSWPDDEVEAWAEAKRLLTPAVIEYVRALRPDWEPVAAAIRCPLLLITAEPERGAIITPAAADRVRELAPQTEVAFVPGAGHSIRREQRAAYLRAVGDFLARHGGA